MAYRVAVILAESFDVGMGLPKSADLAIVRTGNRPPNVPGFTSQYTELEIVHIEENELLTIPNLIRFGNLARDYTKRSGK